MKVIRQGDKWGIAAKFSPMLRAACHTVPGMVFDWATRNWVGPLDAVSRVVMMLQAKGLTIDTAELSDRPIDTAATIYPIAEKGRRAYQLEAVRFLLSKKRALLADAMGLGKTCSALTAARALASNTLIVVPNFAKGVWWNRTSRGEIGKWYPMPDDAVFLPAGLKPRSIPISPGVVLIHYDILHAWTDAIGTWAPRVVIFDECHALMSEKSKRSIAARAVSKDAEMVWGLTGTPLTNRPSDLWNVVDTIRPGEFGGFFSFGLRYCDAHKEAVTPTKTVWKFDGKSNLEELHERLSGFMLHRTVHDVALELPSKTRQVIWVDVPAQAQLLSDPSPKAMRESLDRAADAKVTDAVELIRGHLEAAHRVVVFTWRRSVADFLTNTMREGGFTTSVVHGGISQAERDERISQMRNTPGASLLSATIDTAGVGIDLSYADVCVFVELTWEPYKLLQAEARLHRFGQTRPVLVQYIIARGTTDELITSVVIGKLDTFEKTIGALNDSVASDFQEDEKDVMAALYSAISSMQAPKPKRGRNATHSK